MQNKNPVAILCETEPSSRRGITWCICNQMLLYFYLSTHTTSSHHHPSETWHPTSRHEQTNQNLQQPKIIINHQYSKRKPSAIITPHLQNQSYWISKQSMLFCMHRSHALRWALNGFDWRWYCAKFSESGWWAKWRGGRIYSLLFSKKNCKLYIFFEQWKLVNR